MNTRLDFDAMLRRAHAEAVERVSPRTLVQLRPRHGARSATAWLRPGAWPLAATCAIALVAAGTFLHRSTRDDAAPAPATTLTTTTTGSNEAADVYAALDESPELYLWLASNATPLALE